jgi:N-acetylmuramoyl-L-alanine amidase
MKVTLTILFLAAGLISGIAQNSISKLERVLLFGHEYVRLDDWAAAGNLELKWTRKDEEVQIKSKWSKLVFEMDSRKAEINGVSVWLSVVIARKGNAAYISPLDLQTAIYPVLYPPKNSAGAKIKTICLDPGHGGKDPGNQDGKQQEKKYTLALAQEVQTRLKDAGFKVILTRSADKYVELTDRSEIANQHPADLFISLHFNASPAGSARGAETYCLTPAHASSTNAHGEGTANGDFPGNNQNDRNMFLAWQIQKSLTGLAGTEDRGVKRARFAVLKGIDMPAVLIENGFMTDPDESKRIYDKSYREKLARAIVDGVMSYKKAVERP